MLLSYIHMSLHTTTHNKGGVFENANATYTTKVKELSDVVVSQIKKKATSAVCKAPTCLLYGQVHYDTPGGGGGHYCDRCGDTDADHRAKQCPRPIDSTKSLLHTFSNLCISSATLQPTPSTDTVICAPNKSTVTKNSQQLIFDWAFINSASNKEIYKTLQQRLSGDCSLSSIEQWWTQHKAIHNIRDKLRYYEGRVEDQLNEFHKYDDKIKHVVMNASQTNFLEQQYNGHNPYANLTDFLGDYTFGPGVVKYHTGGPEFLVSTLRHFWNNIYGATQAFFDEAESHKQCLWIEGGYYTSNANEKLQNELANAFQQSSTRVCGFRWQPQREKTHQNHSTYVYQTGAINSNNNIRNNYSDFHKCRSPTPEFEFGVLFTQFYNAMFTESYEQVVFHTTKLGEGVFGNTPNVSLHALVAAYDILPESNKQNIVSISLGCLYKQDIQSLKTFFDETSEGIKKKNIVLKPTHKQKHKPIQKEGCT